MIQKILIFLSLFLIVSVTCLSQGFVNTQELLKRQSSAGTLSIEQSLSVDTLISRYIDANRKVRTSEGALGMKGFRIQIYYSSVRTAREESAKVQAKFMEKFPGMVSYNEYKEPGWYMVRVGDYRTKTELYKDLLQIREVFPNAYFVPAIINFPDQKK